MPGTTGRLRTDPAARLAALERDRPEWRTWLALLREIEPELDRDSQTPAEADPGWLQGLIHRLAAAAGGSIEGFRPDRDEALRLLDAAAREDQDEIAAIAAAAGLDPGPLGSVAHLAALPVLHARWRLQQDAAPAGWPHGHCPVCGAWPALVERRGLDRSHWLRCARCGGAWEVQPLWCIYCGEKDHRKLGSLVPEGAGETLKVDVCETCRGYLKSVATLQPIPPFELLLQDLETVELDLVAMERGYERPVRVTSN